MPYLPLDTFRQPGETEAAKLLGRFVTSPDDPLGDYTPEDPTPLIRRFIDEDTTVRDGKGFVNGLNSSSLKTTILRALSLESSSEATRSLALRSAKIQCRRLKRVEAAFDALMGNRGVAREVEGMMASRRTKEVYMVRGILTAVDAKFTARDGARRDAKVAAQVAVPEELAPVVGPAAGQKAIEVEWGRAREQKSGLEGRMEGLRVIAVEYWACEKRGGGGAGPFRRNKGPGTLSVLGPMAVRGPYCFKDGGDWISPLGEDGDGISVPGYLPDGGDRSAGRRYCEWESDDDDGPSFQHGLRDDPDPDDGKLVLGSVAGFESVELVEWETESWGTAGRGGGGSGYW